MREWPVSEPITGIAVCCVRATSGHAAVAPPSSVMNARRLIVAPRGSKPRTASSHSRPGLGTGQGGCELRPIVLGWECRLWVPRPGQNRKNSESQMASGLPPKTDLPPDLRTTPAANSSRTPSSRPRASARSRALACGPRGTRRRASTSTTAPPALPQLRPRLAPRALDRLDIPHAAAIPMGAEPAATRCSEMVE